MGQLQERLINQEIETVFLMLKNNPPKQDVRTWTLHEITECNTEAMKQLNTFFTEQKEFFDEAIRVDINPPKRQKKKHAEKIFNLQEKLEECFYVIEELILKCRAELSRYNKERKQRYYAILMYIFPAFQKFKIIEEV